MNESTLPRPGQTWESPLSGRRVWIIAVANMELYDSVTFQVVVFHDLGADTVCAERLDRWQRTVQLTEDVAKERWRLLAEAPVERVPFLDTVPVPGPTPTPPAEGHDDAAYAWTKGPAAVWRVSE